MVVGSNEEGEPELNVAVDTEEDNVPNVKLEPEAEEEQEADHLEAEAVRPSTLKALKSK